MEAGRIVRWLRAEGDHVACGDPLFEVDADKVNQEVEAEVSGTLLQITILEGEVPVGETVAFIGAADETLPPFETESRPDPPQELPHHPALVISASARNQQGRVKASPLARRLARENLLPLESISPTGREHRVIAADVRRAAAERLVELPLAVAPERRAFSSARRTLARRLTDAWRIPAFSVAASFDATRLLDAVGAHRTFAVTSHLTVTDMIVHACARALRAQPDLNVHVDDDAVYRFPVMNIGIATSTPSPGVVIPVIPGAERMTLEEIARAREDLVDRARADRLRPSDVQGGTFTISNLGMFHVEQFTAVLNPPQAAILAVAAPQEKVVALAGVVAARPVISLTLTCDHRAVDGATAAAFLTIVKALLEEPALAL